MNKTLELKQQNAYRQMLAIVVLGGSMAALFGTMVAAYYIG